MSAFAIIVRHKAEGGLNKIFAYYENIQQGLRERFMRSVDKCFDKLKQNPFHTYNVLQEYGELLQKIFHTMSFTQFLKQP